MARPSKSVPTYRKHAKSGQAVVTVRKTDGTRQDIYLGAFNSSDSHGEYERILALLRSNAGLYPDRVNNEADMTLAELVARFTREKVEVEFIKPDGLPTSEQAAYRHALQPLVRLFGSTLAREFDAGNLEAVQAAMAQGSWLTPEEVERRKKIGKPVGWCRNVVNKDISRVRSLFKWAVRKKLVPVSVLVDITTVEPLKAGRGKVRDTAKVLPVDLALVESTIPHLPPVVRDMVEVQRLTGMRPGELCSMKVRELDTTGPVWIFRPASHKTQHHGHVRAIAIGPKAQAIVAKYLKPSLEAFVFSPVEQAEIIRLESRAKRKSKVQPSQVDRSRPGASRLNDHFSVGSYGRAIERVCKRKHLPHWRPHQLRHSAALLIEREFGLEAARATLGHRCVNMSAHYSGIDQQRAAEVARKLG